VTSSLSLEASIYALNLHVIFKTFKLLVTKDVFNLETASMICVDNLLYLF